MAETDSRMVGARGTLGQGERSCCLMGMEFQLRKITKILEIVVMWLYDHGNVLNATKVATENG